MSSRGTRSTHHLRKVAPGCCPKRSDPLHNKRGCADPPGGVAAKGGGLWKVSSAAHLRLWIADMPWRNNTTSTRCHRKVPHQSDGDLVHSGCDCCGCGRATSQTRRWASCRKTNFVQLICVVQLIFITRGIRVVRGNGHPNEAIGRRGGSCTTRWSRTKRSPLCDRKPASQWPQVGQVGKGLVSERRCCHRAASGAEMAVIIRG